MTTNKQCHALTADGHLYTLSTEMSIHGTILLRYNPVGTAPSLMRVSPMAVIGCPSDQTQYLRGYLDYLWGV